MTEEKNYVSRAKHEELRKELDELRTGRRREVAARLEFAKSLGDLAENAEYHAAREDQAELEDRIAQIENTLKVAEIVAEKHTSTVGVGSRVAVTKTGGAGEQTYLIVGSEEANLDEAKISYQSPLGSALLGKKKGEHFTITTPKGKADYQVVNIL